MYLHIASSVCVKKGGLSPRSVLPFPAHLSSVFRDRVDVLHVFSLPIKRGVASVLLHTYLILAPTF
jgi:hypothetical protein